MWIAYGVGCNSVAEPPERGSIQLLIGNGDGTFVPGWQLPAPAPRSVLLADLDGDSRAELVVPRYDNAVAVYAENVNGEYELQREYEVENLPNKIVALDVNADAIDDWVVACTREVNVLLGTGDGEMLAPRAYRGGDNTGLATLDFDRDSITDLVMPYSNGVLLLRGTQDGDFEEFATLAVPSVVHDVETADVNKDGYTDILATAMTIGLLVPDHGSVYVLAGGPTGFALPTTYDTSNPGQELTVADLDSDGWTDILVTGGDAVTVGRGRATGSFDPFIEHVVGSAADSAQVDDFNGDMQPDVVVTHTNGQVSVALGSGTVYGLGIWQSYPAGFVPSSFIATDLNHDGRQDLLVVNEGNHGIP
jgi:hypothetical protein